MPEKVKRNNEFKKIARYFCVQNSVNKCLFYVLPEKSKLKIFFLSDVLDCLFLPSELKNTVYVILKHGIVGISFPIDIRCVFIGGRLIFQLHSVDLFDELVKLTFFNHDEINLGCGLENKISGMGVVVLSKGNEENSFFSKIRKLSFFSLVSFLIHNDMNDFWGIKIPVIKDGDFSDSLLLQSNSFKRNFRNLLAFYLNSPLQSNVVFSGKILRKNKNIFLIFLFTAYVFNENELCRKLFSFSGDFVFSVLRMREELDFYIAGLIKKKKLLTEKAFFAECEDYGFFIGNNCFLFFCLKDFYNKQKYESNFFLLNDRCFVMNRKKYFGSVHKDWGLALSPGSCIPFKKGKKYQLVIYPQQTDEEIQFEYKSSKVSVKTFDKRIRISYDFPLLEKILIIISPSEIFKIRKNGEYAPLIVKKKNDCIELNCDEIGEIEIYLN